MKTQTISKLPPILAKSIDEIDRLLASGKSDLVLDFVECTFITVDGLEWLEELLLRSASLQSEVTLVNIRPTIYKVFKVARIDSILKACGAAPITGPAC